MKRGRRNRGGEAGPSHERWLVSYGDFVTLLFAFFVVLYSSSQTNSAKTRQMAAAIQAAFQRLAMFHPSSAEPDLSRTASLASAGPPALAAAGLPALPAPPSPGAWRQLAEQARQQELIALAAQIRAALGPQIAARQVLVSIRREGVVVSLEEAGFYDSGSAVLLPGAMGPLERIAAILIPRRNQVRFAGHTDNVPIHNAQFKSNWALSTARAVGLVELFITAFHFPPARLSAAGYGEYHPIASNATAIGRQINRRVDIVILPAPPRLVSPAKDRRRGASPESSSSAAAGKRDGAAKRGPGAR